uniref:Protein kinase domain-containing protein n=1 Tax=Steinernema glaseri TaxID=37863 RepID=A0A1I7XZE0_9BILA
MRISHGAYDLFNDFVMNYRINMKNLVIFNEDIRQGHYGTVYKGQYTLPNGERMLVACKTPQHDRLNSVEDFLCDADVISRLNHRRILQFVGVHYDVTNQTRPLLVTKYMANGDL